MTPREKSWPSSVHTGDPLAQNTEGRKKQRRPSRYFVFFLHFTNSENKKPTAIKKTKKKPSCHSSLSH